MFILHGVQIGDTVTVAVETMVVVGKIGVMVTISVIVAMVEYMVVLWTALMVKYLVVVMMLVSVVVVTLVTVSVSIEVDLTVCVFDTVDVWVVGVTLAQKPLRNMSTFCSHSL